MSEEHDKTVQISTDSVQTATCTSCGCEVDVSSLTSFSDYTCPQCGSIETVPAKLGPFVLLNMIGTGGMGGVYRAKDESLGRMVAIKVMLKSLGDDPKFIETFQREAQSAAKLNHPNIAQIYSFGQEKGQPYIVMEYIAGGSLDKMISPKKPANQALIMRVGYEIAQGLRVADEVGLIHGDIKPENILFDDKLNSKLVDFGLASYANQASQEGIWGTPYYIAPEKLKRQKVDSRSDIYSLGATLYHAAAGIPPFDGKTPLDVVKARLKKPPVPLNVARKGLDPVVVQVIMRMLEADLARRYPNYGSLISDLKKAVDTLGDDRKAAKTQKKLRVKSSSTTNIPDASSTKIVFKKTTTSSIPELSKYKTYTTSASAAKSSIPTAPRKKSLAGLWITLGIVALLGVGVAGAVAMRNNRMAREAEQNALAIQGYRKKSKDTHAQIKSCVDNIMETKKEADNIVTSAKKIVGDLLGKHVLIKPRAPEQTAETDNTKDDGTPRFQEPKIKLLAGDILGYANILENDVKDTNLLIGTSDNLLSTVMSATSVSIAAEKSKGLDNNLLSAQTIEKKTTENIKTMKDIFAKMLEIKEKEKKGQQNDAEEEKRRKEEEEQRKKELAEQAASEEEKNTVQSAAQTALTQIKENRFKEALETIQSQTKDLKTSAAIEQAKLAMERAARVYQLFQFTGKTISAKPFAKGWTEGVANPMDITGATPDYLVVSGTKVPWEKVSSKQMLRIMDYSLQEGDVKGSQLAEYYLSAAIYCNMVGGDEAMSVSKYRNNALKFLPRLSEDADRLLESN